MLNRIKDELVAGTAEHKGFVVKQEFLWYKDRLVLSRNSSLLPAILEEFHSSPSRGHSGEQRTFQRWQQRSCFGSGCVRILKNLSGVVLFVKRTKV